MSHTGGLIRRIKMNYDIDPDTLQKIRKAIQKRCPEHLNGFDKGWLEIEEVEGFETNFYHVRSDGEVVFTLAVSESDIDSPINRFIDNS